MKSSHHHHHPTLPTSPTPPKRGCCSRCYSSSPRPLQALVWSIRRITELIVIETIGRLLDGADKVARILGPLLLSAAALLVVSCTTEYSRHIVPPWSSSEFTFWTGVNIAMVMFCIGNLVYNYFRCAISEPGYTEGLKYRDILAVQDPAASSLPPEAAHEVMFCRECNAPKPRRVHHCSVCKKCVMKMDHHCPWVNNCVGVRTYPYFVRLLFWVVASCIIFGISGIKTFTRMWYVCDPQWVQEHQAELHIQQSKNALLHAGGAAAAAAAAGAGAGAGTTIGGGSMSWFGRRLFIIKSPKDTSAMTWWEYIWSIQVSLDPDEWYNWVVMLPSTWFGTKPFFVYLYTKWWADQGILGCNRLFSVCYAIAVCVGTAVALLFLFHIYLTLTGQTSIEFYRNRGSAELQANAAAAAREKLRGRTPRRHQYDFGARQNWYHTFGTYSIWSWCLPPSWVGIRGITASKKKGRDVEEVFGKLSSAFAKNWVGAAAGAGAGAGAASGSTSTATASSGSFSGRNSFNTSTNYRGGNGGGGVSNTHENDDENEEDEDDVETRGGWAEETDEEDSTIQEE